MRKSKTLELFESFKNEYENVEKINESEEYSFQEIITRMENATDYSELYDAALLIKDSKLRTDVEQAIGQCEDDGDNVETAYSIVTSDLLDSKIEDINEGEGKLPDLREVKVEVPKWINEPKSVKEKKKLKEHTESWLTLLPADNHRVKPFVELFKKTYPNKNIDKLWLESIEGGWESCVAFIESDGTTYRVFVGSLNDGTYMSDEDSVKIANSNFKSDYDYIRESERFNDEEPKFKVFVNTPFGQINIDVVANSKEEASKIALEKVQAAFVDSYKDKVEVVNALSLNETEKVNEDLVRTDVPASKGYGPDVNVSLNTLRDTLATFDRFYEITEELEYSEGLSDEFYDSLTNFFDSAVDKEYNRIKDEVEKTEKREMKNK